MKETEITALYKKYHELLSEMEKVQKKINKIHRNCVHGDAVCNIIRTNGYYNCTTCNKEIPLRNG